MALSEHEQRILIDLEESLLRQDPQFVKSVSKITNHTHRWRTLSLVGFLSGLAILVTFFSASIPLGLAGLALMLGSSLVFSRNAAIPDHAARKQGK